MMLLTAANIFYYLRARGLVSDEAVVGGDFRVIPQVSRNRHFQVQRAHGLGYFVKQVLRWEPAAVGSLRAEAQCLALAQTDPAFAPLAAIAPRYYEYDPMAQVLIMELIRPAENLRTYHQRKGNTVPLVAQRLGTALGTYHRQMISQWPNIGNRVPISAELPWILRITHLVPDDLQQSSLGAAQVVALVQHYPEFAPLLDELCQAWRPMCLIHGDLKWENCLLVSPAETETDSAIRVVDWEFAAAGDPGWDIGTILQMYLVWWASGVPVNDQQYREASLWEAMLPALHAFWASYATAAELDQAAQQALLLLSLRYGAARLIQTAYEAMHTASDLSAAAVRLLQLSLNILEDPPTAVEQLLEL